MHYKGLDSRRLDRVESHVILKKETSEGAVGCVIPLHRELKVGTLRGILRQAKVTPDEFMDVL